MAGKQLLLASTLVVSVAGLVYCGSDNKSPDAGVGGTIPCNADTDCPPNLPMCTPDSKICVGCIDSFITCGPGLTCDQASHTCVPLDPTAPCHKNSDCPRPGFDSPDKISCEPDGGACVGCSNNVECVPPDECIQQGPKKYTCGDVCSTCTSTQRCIPAGNGLATHCEDIPQDGGAPDM